MSITWCSGDILQDNAEALVNAVNCVGVASAGLALAFKKKFQDNYKAYNEYCRRGRLRPGDVFVDTWHGPVTRLYSVATKNHWREQSELLWVQRGLSKLNKLIHKHGVKRIAIPALGCGLGGLAWRDVKPVIELYMEIVSVDVRVYEPQDWR